MKNILLFTSCNNNKYIYSKKNLLYLPKELQEQALKKESHYLGGSYYQQKIHFWKEHGLFGSEHVDFKTDMEVDVIKQHLGNLKQLLIEVTDDCNLACKYCGYRDLYTNYDAKIGKKQTFKKVKLFIDYLANIWKSPNNISHNNVITIGFYGGEPLLEINLIKQIVEYIDGLKFENIIFKYNMTTNAMLLNKCMDFLENKKINLLISLDGNKFHQSYRITKNGKSSYNAIVKNINCLREKYSEYYDKYINFNAVLHNRNSFKEVSDFIGSTFGKTPRIAELTTNGIAEDKIDEFFEMFQSKLESTKGNYAINEELASETLFSNPEVLLFNNFMDSIAGNTII